VSYFTFTIIPRNSLFLTLINRMFEQLVHTVVVFNTILAQVFKQLFLAPVNCLWETRRHIKLQSRCLAPVNCLWETRRHIKLQSQVSLYKFVLVYNIIVFSLFIILIYKTADWLGKVYVIVHILSREHYTNDVWLKGPTANPDVWIWWIIREI
jgi:hypothetical protein